VQPARAIGRDATTVRMANSSSMPAPGMADTPPAQRVEMPAVSTAAGLDDLPGVMSARPTTEFASRGPGSGAGAGGGRGPGSGPGDGTGLGPGQGGNHGGGPMQPGGDVSWPRLLRDVKPQYTVDALRARAQGLIELRVVVLADGTVGGVDIVRGFQPPFGLDDEAVKAVRGWRFEPARQRGKPVAVVVPVELSFSLR
jgi:protein TonB